LGMHRRPHAALLALKCGGRVPVDLAEEVVRAMLEVLEAARERVKARLRRIDVRQMISILVWYYHVEPAPLQRLIYDPCSAQHWLEIIERCDEELCSTLVMLAARRDALPLAAWPDNRPDLRLRRWVSTHPDYISRIESAVAEILHPDILEYAEAIVGCAINDKFL